MYFGAWRVELPLEQGSTRVVMRGSLKVGGSWHKLDVGSVQGF